MYRPTEVESIEHRLAALAGMEALRLGNLSDLPALLASAADANTQSHAGKHGNLDNLVGVSPVPCSNTCLQLITGSCLMSPGGNTGPSSVVGQKVYSGMKFSQQSQPGTFKTPPGGDVAESGESTRDFHDTFTGG